MLSSSQVPEHPLEKIALSCSGGGYRATAFHLGSMSYLNKLKYRGTPLLENVELISTVSGGTITGVVYALQKQQGKDFHDIYTFLMEKLYKVDLLKDGIKGLNTDSRMSNSFKQKNLINILAELYDLHMTDGATMSEFTNMKSHLKHVVFNSTDFKNALNFKFRNLDEYGDSGTYYLPVRDELAKEIKLSDIIASSSCFPGGFEPIRWPHDFVHDNAPKLKTYAQNREPIGLMDGGIYDNQGIDSILKFRKKKDKPPYFDLVIISDVASPYMKPYEPTEPKQKSGFRKLTLNKLKKTIRSVSMIINVLLLIIIACGVAIISVNQTGTLITNLSWILTITTSVLLLAKFAVPAYIRSALSSASSSIASLLGPFYLERLRLFDIGNLSVHRAEPLLLDRIKSLVTLLMDVFLKVVRRLNYSILYENEQYKYRRVANLIKELTQKDFEASREREKNNWRNPPDPNFLKNSKLRGDYKKVIGEEIQDIIEYSSSFGTTLWFEDSYKLNDMLDNLVASGQFTMCYNMLEYLEKIKYEKDSGFDQLPEATQQELNKLHEQCLNDWQLFKSNPMFMVEEMAVTKTN